MSAVGTSSYGFGPSSRNSVPNVRKMRLNPCLIKQEFHSFDVLDWNLSVSVLGRNRTDHFQTVPDLARK